VRLWTFEPYLVGALNGVAWITARSYRDADYGLLCGVELRTDSGSSARIRLIGVSNSTEEAPAGHAANLARLDGREEPHLTPVAEDLAVKVEQLLGRIIPLNQPTGFHHLMTLRDRRQALKLRGGTSAAPGLHVAFTNGDEVFATITG
jgi:hypothetical protein